MSFAPMSATSRARDPPSSGLSARCGCRRSRSRDYLEEHFPVFEEPDRIYRSRPAAGGGSGAGAGEKPTASVLPMSPRRCWPASASSAARSTAFTCAKTEGRVEPVPHRWLEIDLPGERRVFYDPQYQDFSSRYLVTNLGVSSGPHRALRGRRRQEKQKNTG